MSKWTVEHVAPNVHVVNVEMDGLQDTFEVFLSSDWHWDHPECNRSVLAEHLDEAKGANAPIFVFGDALCVMQSQHDKRRTKGRTLPEHDRPDYFTAISDDFADWLEPWQDQLAVLADGNHETSVIRNSGVDVLHHVVDSLRVAGAPHVGKGGYAGYVRFRFKRGNQRQSVRLCYHHGFGGSAPATRGTLKVNRQMVMAVADIYYQGHDHNRWVLPEAGQRLNDANNIVPVYTLHVHGGSYKASSGVSVGGWETEKGMGLRPLGGYFLRFWIAPKRDHFSIRYGARDPMPNHVGLAS